METSTVSVNPKITGDNSNFSFVENGQNSFPEHDLISKTVLFNGKPTGQQAISYKGNFISFRGKDYHVFPHENLFAAIDPIMEKLGATPHHSFTKENPGFFMKFGKNKAAEVEANSKYYNGKKYYVAGKVRATYTFKDEKFDVTGSGDFVKFGSVIENTIDGSGAMKIIPYSLREVCTNGMMHNATVVQISEHILEKLRKQQGVNLDTSAMMEHVESIMSTAKSFDELMHKIKSERMSHMTKIPVEWITSRIYLIKESVDVFKNKYREMTKLLTTQDQAMQIANRLPKRLVDKLEWLDVSTVDTEVKGADGVPHMIPKRVVKINTKTTQWKAFNDITEDLTHNPRAFDSKGYAYKQLDKIMVMNS